MHGQCTFDFSADINDLETVQLQISVNGLINNDLSGSQGLCAVELRFRHSYVGDLTIDLTSPAGQSVQLVGDVTDQINPTNLTTWDVRFLQCGFPAAPDAGFAAQWSNNQAWQVFTNYTGSYYPFAGCFEDFNTGSANGFWSLTIIDHDSPQTGELLSVALIFCDGTGLECSVCGADAGFFAQTAFRVCESTDVILMPDYPDTIPDPQLYGYTFLVTEANSNPIFVDQVLTSDLVPGNYMICGLSYLFDDSTALFNQLDTLSLPEIQMLFSSDNLLSCADMTSTCITLSIDPYIDTTFLARQICQGEVITIGGQSFNSTGTFIVTLDQPSICDSVVVLDLVVITVVALVTQADTITCMDGMTTLDGNSSIAGPGAEYAWSTSNGMIIGPTDQPVITIDGSGTYRLVVIYQNCQDEIFFDAIGDNSIPFLFVEGGTLDCNNATYTFNTVAFPSNVGFNWVGPSGFSSAEARPIVSEPGIYTLLVTNPEGCSQSASVEVVIDTVLTPGISIVRVECDFQRVTLQAAPATSGTQYLWTSPTGATSTYIEFYATVSGQYCVEVTGSNGCVKTLCTDYVADYSFPDLSATVSSDSLNCSAEVDLIASSTVTNLDYVWIGSGGVLVTDSVTSVNSPGQYIVLATSSNSCTSRDTVQVFPGDDLVDFGVFADTLDCDTDTVLIGVAVLDPIMSYTWSGPGLVDTFDAFVQVTQPGTYEVTFVSQGGCIQHAFVSVPGDYATVFYNLLTDTLTCEDPVANLSFVTSHPYVTIDWLLPDGSHRNTEELNTSVAGVYLLTITGHNGCPRTLGLNLTSETDPPVLFVESALLGCNDSVQIQTIRVDSIQSFDWSGPGGFTSTDANPFVQTAGNYVLEAIGTNGCTQTYVHFVESNMDFPSLTLSAEDLDCIDSAALLSIVSPDTALVFAWFVDGVLFSDSSDVLVTEPGDYVGQVTLSNGCATNDTIEVKEAIVPQLMIEADTITCVTPATLNASSDLMGVVFGWEDALGMTGTGTQFTTFNAGPTIVTVTGMNGCARDTMVLIEIDSVPPVAVASNSEMILCNVRSINLDASGSLGQAISYFWTTMGGIIDSGANTPSPRIIGEGVYVLEVTEAVNGCKDTDTIAVVEGQGTLNTIHLTAISECEGNGNGSITIDSVPGALTALTYFVNDQMGGPLFDQLTDGEYRVLVVDSFGCSVDTVIAISNTSSMSTISLGEDKSILVGDTVLLEVLVDIDPSEILAINWGGTVLCDSCLINAVAPLETKSFTVFLTDAFGCVASDEVTVFVDERPKFFIPNVFSPNGDDINDDLGISAHPGIDKVLEFSVYDRWGNTVYEALDFDASDHSIRWDGTFGGRDLNPGVFVYVLKVKLITGRVITNHGTITIVK